jgi:hypothetical protein
MRKTHRNSDRYPVWRDGNLSGEFAQTPFNPALRISAETCLGDSLCHFCQVFDERTERRRHGVVADMNGVDRISCNDGNDIFILVGAGPEIIDHGYLEESRFVDHVMQASRLIGRHVVEVKVHRQFPAHDSPGPSKVDHRHLYLPLRCQSLPNDPRKFRAMTGTEEIRLLEDLFVYDDPLGEAGSARKIETTTARLIINFALQLDSSAEIQT